VVHPSAGHDRGTLVNALIHHCGASLSGIGGVRRPGIVHRLDKDTTGLLVVAKTDVAHAGLSEQFAAHGADGRMHRIYQALVWGEPLRPKGHVDAALGRHPTHRTRMAVVSQNKGRHAVTHYECTETLAFGSAQKEASGRAARPLPHGGQAAVLDQGPRLAMMRLELETGRTHQIRVHMAHIGHPVVGDPVYGAGFRSRSRIFPEPVRQLLDRVRRQMLHAGELGFEHPVTGEALEFSSPLPDDFSLLVKALREEVPER